MKWLACVVFLCVLGCKSDPIQQNPYLNNLPPFEFELSLDLPLYDGLRFAGGSKTPPVRAQYLPAPQPIGPFAAPTLN